RASWSRRVEGGRAAYEDGERARDAHDLVELESSRADDRDQQVAGQAGRARLGGGGHEGQAPGRVAVGESREAGAPPVRGEGEDLAALPIGHEEQPGRAGGEGLRDRALE